MLLTTLATDALVAAMSAEAVVFGAGVDLEFRLIGADFALDPNAGEADLTYLTGNGLTPKTFAAGDATIVRSGIGGTYGMLLHEPAGGMNFTNTAVDSPDPQVAYGYALVNLAEVALIAICKFTTPVTFDIVGKTIELSALVAQAEPDFIGGNESIDAVVP